MSGGRGAVSEESTGKNQQSTKGRAARGPRDQIFESPLESTSRFKFIACCASATSCTTAHAPAPSSLAHTTTPKPSRHHLRRHHRHFALVATSPPSPPRPRRHLAPIATSPLPITHPGRSILADTETVIPSGTPPLSPPQSTWPRNRPRTTRTRRSMTLRRTECYPPAGTPTSTCRAIAPVRKAHIAPPDHLRRHHRFSPVAPVATSLPLPPHHRRHVAAAQHPPGTHRGRRPVPCSADILPAVYLAP